MPSIHDHSRARSFLSQPMPSHLYAKVHTSLSKATNLVTAAATQVLSALRDMFNPVYRTSKFSSRDSARQLVNFGFKKTVSSKEFDSAGQKHLHAAYDGDAVSYSLRNKFHYAQKFQQENEGHYNDPEGISRIVKHRKIMAEMAQHRSARTPKAHSRRVQALTDPDSEQVVQLGNGGATFSIPGGFFGHYITQEIKMIPDQNGVPKYYFVIHNRGRGLTHRLHSSLRFEDKNGVLYTKTSLAIEVPKELLSEAFFKGLASASRSLKGSIYYDFINKHLLQNGGKIQRSDLEIKGLELREKHAQLYNQGKSLKNTKNKLIMALNDPNEFKKILTTIDHPELKKSAQSLIEAIDNNQLSPSIASVFIVELEKVQKQVNESRVAVKKELEACWDALIETDDSFNSKQVYGTCTESNRTGPEKQMASPSARRQLKLYTIQQMTEGVKKQHLLFRSHKKQLLELSRLRQKELQQKIDS